MLPIDRCLINVESSGLKVSALGRQCYKSNIQKVLLEFLAAHLVHMKTDDGYVVYTVGDSLRVICPVKLGETLFRSSYSESSS